MATVSRRRSTRAVAVSPSDPDALLDALVGLAPRVVLTLGPLGVAYLDRQGTRLRVPAPVVSTVDSTAAGDAFTAASVDAGTADRRCVAVGLCGRCGVCAAARRVERAALRAEIDELYLDTYRPESGME